MASNTETVNGTVVSPDGNTLTSGEISFILSGRDIDDDAAEVIHPIAVTAVIGNDGTFSIELWPPDRGTFGTVYRVIAQGQTISGPVSVDYGNIQPLDGNGPFDLDDLLGVGVTGPGQIFSYLTEGQYNAVLAAATSAEEDAAAAGVSAGQAADSASDAADDAAAAAASASAADSSASDAADDAGAAASSAASAEASAISAGAIPYPDIAAGLAATSDGEYFYVPSNGALYLYEDDGGSEALSTVIGKPVFATLSAFKAAVAAGYAPLLGTEQTVNGIDYVYDTTTTYLPGLSGWKFRLEPIVLLGLGQSNMRGAVESVGGDMTFHDGIIWWNGRGGSSGDEWTLPQVPGDYPLDRSPDGGVTYANNLAYACAREIHETTGRPVAGISYALGGHPAVAFVTPAGRTANSWTLPGGDTDISLAMYPGIADALSALGRTYVDREVIMQGEADRDTLDVWADQWEVIFEEQEAAGVYDPDHTRVAIGMINRGVGGDPDQAPFQIVAATKLAEVTHGNIGYFLSDGVSSNPGDPIHFSGGGLVSMGRRGAGVLSSNLPGKVSMSGDYTVTLMDESGNVCATTATGLWTWQDGVAHVWFDDLSDIDVTGMEPTDLVRISLPFTSQLTGVTQPGIIEITELDSVNWSGEGGPNKMTPRVSSDRNYAVLGATRFIGDPGSGGITWNRLSDGVSSMLDFQITYRAKHV